MIVEREDLNIEIFEPNIFDFISPESKVEVLAKGYRWTEGPLWVEEEKMLLFSEIPSNTVYKWTENEGVHTYLKPSGYTGDNPEGLKEPGSNGLLLDNNGNLVLCQHGNRQIARMNAALKTPQSEFIPLVNKFNGKRLNSPNDAVFTTDGSLFFTDPPYGLPSQSDNDPLKEIDFNGVFMLKKDGNLSPISKELTRPNGIAFFSNEQKFIVSNSDPKAAIWYIFDRQKRNKEVEIFFDASSSVSPSNPGLPDGLKISSKNIVYASGPGGVWIFNSEGKLLAKIKFKQPVSNIALSKDEKFLFLTNTGRVVRIALK